MTKYIFVTGGVISSLGKGVTAASLGYLLKNQGLKVNFLKFDPYLNVDPGTMSPYQHGEVFVTADGAETDLDLGHYERFIDEDLHQENNVTAGQIYETVIRKERKGDFLGKTIQVIPHITDEIKQRIKNVSGHKDVVIVEIGGTVGDIESLPFLEAIRQFKQDVQRENVLYLHITYVPYLKFVQELKTKPTQHSVSKLREIGIEPDILVCRTEKPLTPGVKDKLALFCNIEKEAIIEEIDVKEYIYEIPLLLEQQGLDSLIMNKFSLKARKRKNLSPLKELVERMKNPAFKVKIGIAGKYTELKDAYKSICEALIHAGVENNTKVEIEYIDVQDKNLEQKLKEVDGILVPGGFGERGIEGKIDVTNFARKNKIPFLGICLGMQCAVIGFAREVCGLKNANSSEFVFHPQHSVISLMSNQGKMKTKKGATMRKGNYLCQIKKGTLAAKIYKTKQVYERHRHRYELNNRYLEILQKNGMIISGVNPQTGLAEIIELKNHPWFIAVQFHPEFRSRPGKPHPLFREFVKVAVKNKKGQATFSQSEEKIKK